MGYGDIGTAFKVGRQLFQDFVRINIGQDFNANGDDLEGSRASDKIEWYSIYYTKSGVNNLLEPDNQTVTASNPLMIGNNGNGTCVVETLSGAANMGYKLIFDASPQKWELKNANNTSVATATPQPGPPPKKWIITDPGKVTVTITNGTVPFVQGSSFVFSVFKSVLGKTNATQNVGIGTIPPIGDNF